MNYITEDVDSDPDQYFHCEVCGDLVWIHPQSRNHKYCGKTCSMRAYRKRAKEKVSEDKYYHGQGVTDFVKLYANKR